MSFTSCVQARYDNDVAGIQAAIDGSGLSSGTKTALSAILTAAAADLNASAVSETGFDNTMPFTQETGVADAHAGIFRAQATLWNTMGHTVMRAWAANPWKYYSCYGVPESVPGTWSTHFLKNQHRAVLVRVANPAQSTMNVTLSISGLTGSPVPDWATVSRVPWSDTAPMQEMWSRDGPVQTALEQITPSAEGWSMEVLPGLVGEFWIDLCPDTEFSGHATVTVTDGTTSVDMSLEMRVYDVDAPAISLDLGSWDRLDDQTRTTVDLVEYLGNYGWNSPLITGWGFVIGDGVSSYTTDPFVLTMNFTALNAWLAANADAHRIIIWEPCATTDADEPANPSNESNPDKYYIEGRLGLTGSHDTNLAERVGEWALQLRNNLDSIGMLDKVYLHLFDEPNSAAQFEIAINYMSAIKSAAPDLRILGNPNIPATGPQDLDTDYLQNIDLFMEVYNDFQAKAPVSMEASVSFLQGYGEVQFYEAAGPWHGQDPWYVNRLMGIRSYNLSTGGMNYWFVHNHNFGGYPFVYRNEYSATVPGYLTLPYFIESDAVHSSKQLEAMREGLQDYEELKLLEQLIAAKPWAYVSEAQAALDAMKGIDDYADQFSVYMAWQDGNTVKGDYSSLDDAREDVLEWIWRLTNAASPRPPGRSALPLEV